MEATKYLEVLKEIRDFDKANKLNLDKEIVITILQEVGKDYRAVKTEVTDRKKVEDITPKQKALLEKLGKYKEGMTKQEAFTIIKELSNKRNKEDEY